jgi:hypothetical protein
MGLNGRIQYLEQLAGLDDGPEDPGPVRHFTCDGSAADDGLPFDQSAPLRPGIWAMFTCTCTGLNIGERCRNERRDQVDSFTIEIDRTQSFPDDFETDYA